ncbi:MAG: hypothetical protein KDD63_03045 [Bacteroidetes bacterium]|nr:hypothetical protein [Bacteroidota bacterium]
MMNSNLLKLKPVLFVLTISLLFLSSSCMMTQTTVGAYKESAGAEYEYAKGKQVWLFEGLIPLGRTDVSTPTDGYCKAVTKFTFVDFLISGLTAGLVRTYTIKVYAKRAE